MNNEQQARERRADRQLNLDHRGIVSGPPGDGGAALRSGFSRNGKSMLASTPHPAGVSGPTTFRGPSPSNPGPSASPDSVAIRRMWEGGPLRQVAETPVSPVYRAYVCGGSRCTFAGRYVCDGCMEPAIGVYRQKRSGLWVCRGCL